MTYGERQKSLLRLTLMLGVGVLSFSAMANTVMPAPCSQRMALVERAGPASEGDAESAVIQGFGASRLWGEGNFAVVKRNAQKSGDSTMEGPAKGDAENHPENDLENNALRVTYPANTSSPSDSEATGLRGGGGFYTSPAALEGSDHACLGYQVRFPDGFDFVKGGKLPGLYGGDAPSGGHQADGHNGFSLRLMWREAGQGELYTYVLEPQEAYGVSIGRGNWHFPRGKWVSVELEAVLNSPGERNGIARVWIAGEPVIERTDIVYRDTPALGVDGLMFSTFFGGTGKGWRTPRRQHVEFSDFRFYRPAS